MNGFRRYMHACAPLALVTVSFISGCKGGYGYPGDAVPTSTSTSSSIPAATASPTTLSCAQGTSTQTLARHKLSGIPPAAVTAVPSTTYALTSNPAGATVTNNGSALGMTPLSFNPVFADTANVVTFTSGSQSYSVCLTQAGFPSRTILYNAAADTSGSITIAGVSSQTIARQSVARQSILMATMPRHPLRTSRDSPVSPNLLVVKYDVAHLASVNESISAVEHTLSIASSRQLGPSSGSIIAKVVRVPAGSTAQTLTNQLLAATGVVGVYPVHLRRALSVTPMMPNDPDFASGQLQQWDMYQINAPYAWGITTGSSTVAIAIIDTGYDPNNADLNGKVTFAESVVNGVITLGAAAAQDTEGHGTNVSGIAAADTNNGMGVAGTGYNLKLQEYRIFPNPDEPTYDTADPTQNTFMTTDEAQVIYDAISNGAKVLSLSYGGFESQGVDQAEYDAIEYAISQGVTVVAAAGNETANDLDFPAGYPKVIAVGASALNDTVNPNLRTAATEYVASYSNSGPGLALVAPGGDISSILGNSDPDVLHWITNLDTTQPATTTPCSDPTNCIGLFEGTSQATPHVAAAAGLMLSINPNLTPAQIKTILMANADNINDPRQGAGRLNLYRTLAAVAGVAAVPAPTAPVFTNFVAFAYTNSGSTVPTIANVNFPAGVPVNADGTFRLADINGSASSYKIGVWADTNGDGIIDAGDYFGATATVCPSNAPCTAASGIAVAPVSGTFALP